MVASMRLRLKAANVFLVLVCAYFLPYTFAVYMVADSLYVTDGVIAWRSRSSWVVVPYSSALRYASGPEPSL